MLKPTDRTVVSGEIDSINDEITRLEAKKSALLGQLENLDLELTKLQDQRAKLTSRIAAIWTLPNEILSYIFELGASNQEEEDSKFMDDDSSDVPDIPDFQILVSHVSRHFRNVAINTPSLWSVIHVLDLAPARLDYIRTCLLRSGSLPFSISLDCEEENCGFSSDTKFSDTAVDEALCLIRPNIFRLERFTARFRFFELLYRVMVHLQQPAPLLKTLELFEVDYEQSFDEEMSFSPYSLRRPQTLFNGDMPALTRLMLDGVHVAWSECNFKNLVSLSLGYHTKDVRPTYQEFQTIIQNSPSLRELSLQGSAPLLSEDVSVSSLYEPFSLEALEELRISDISSDYAPTLISLFRAPNLKSLVLSELDTNDYSTLFDRIAGPPALFPSLASLKLVSIQADDAAAARLLRAYPKLESLGLYALRDCPQWVELLENTETGGNSNESTRTSEHLCPALQCLRCVDIDLEEIKDVFIKRKEAKLPLPKLQLDKRKEKSLFNDNYTLDWLKENTEVEFIDPSDYGSDDDSTDDSAWISEEDDAFPYIEYSDGFDYDDEEDGIEYEDDDQGDDDDEEEEEEEGEDAYDAYVSDGGMDIEEYLSLL